MSNKNENNTEEQEDRYEGEERRKSRTFTEDEIDEIWDHLEARMYTRFGRATTKFILWLAGSAGIFFTILFEKKIKAILGISD